jgi:GntR family transcriptional regulator
MFSKATERGSLFMPINPVLKSKLTDTVKREIKEYIEKMDLADSAKLPSEEHLAEMMSVSRVTIRRAFSELEMEGIIFRKHGQGTFANKEALKVDVNLMELIDFSDIIYRNGYKPSHKIIGLKEIIADAEVADALSLETGTKVIKVEYLLYADRKPGIIAVGWCPEEIFHTYPDIQQWEDNPCFSVLRTNAGKIVSSDRVKIKSISKAGVEEILGHPAELTCDAFLYFDSVGFDQSCEPVIYGKAFFDTSIIQFGIYRKL